jgi:hypothetical protein
LHHLRPTLFMNANREEVVMKTRVTLSSVVVALLVVLCTAQGALGQVEWTHHTIAVLADPGSRNLPGDVVYDGTYYHMYVVGGPVWNPFDQTWKVYHWRSNSVEGPWEWDPENPVLEPGAAGAWDDFTIGSLAVLHHDKIFKMWYAGTADQGAAAYAGYATNNDGDGDWVKQAGPLPGLDPGPPGAWDANGTWPSSVLFDGTQYHMWFTTGSGTWASWTIGHATSSDGTVWSKAPEPVLVATEPWEGDRVYSPEVVPIGGSLAMWYTAYPSGADLRIGYAVSPDGIHWGKWPDNPVLSPLPPATNAEAPTVILEGDTVHGWVGNDLDIYHVTSPFEVLLFDDLESGDTTIWSWTMP